MASAPAPVPTQQPATPQEQQQQQAGLTHENVVEAHESHAKPSRIVAIALDASKYSEYAFSWAIQNIVRPETDQVVLLNVRPAVSLPAFEAIEAANKKESHDLLRAYAQKLPPNKYNVRGVALRGDPRDEIAYKVDDIKADMLVVGSRGLGAFKRAFLGSTSDYLVHHVSCPVIIPRPTRRRKNVNLFIINNISLNNMRQHSSRLLQHN
ncbi:hypothetical protein BC829DRAFT_382528, partial [Chytridium lagenaria]